MKYNDNIIKFIANEDFLDYVFNDTQSKVEYWKSFLANTPEQRDDFLCAKNLLLHLNSLSNDFSKEEIEELEKRIRVSKKA